MTNLKPSYHPIPEKRSLASCGRSICARAPWLIGLLVFVLSANGWLGTATAGSYALVPVGDETPTGVNAFDAETNIAGSSAVRHECTSVAAARWLPNSTLHIGYLHGDFTVAERAAFHWAVSSWQEALAQTSVGIVLEETGEIDRTTEPARSQIIVKRDHSMDSRFYGKIVASARSDNYLDRAFILINASLHKRDDLRKTLLHELGHGFGLRDCLDCRSGVTVMNYFSQQLVMGFKIRKAGTKISDRPTACDISQVVSGYLQSISPALSGNAEEASENTRTIVADETDGSPAIKSGDSDDNIIAPYLKPAPAPGANVLRIASYFKLAPEPLANILFAPYPKPARAPQDNLFERGLRYLKPASAQSAGRSPIAPYFKRAADDANAFAIGPYLKPALAKGVNANAVDPYAKSIAADKGHLLAFLKLAPEKEGNTLAIAPHLNAMSATEANMVTIAPHVRKKSSLTDAEKTEFESYIPTLLGREAETMGELNNYTFRRDLRIQTIDSKGRVSGEYRRISDIVFDDSGARIERGLSLSESTLRRLKISREYVEDFSGAQLKGFELSRRDHYRIEAFMEDTIDGVGMRVYRMTPLNLSAERAGQARVFYGFVWVDEKTGKIVKLAGCALPDDKQRYPLFETERALIDEAHLFPAHTVADDYLIFPSHTVHIRMLITYTNYKRFASRVRIVEADGN